MIDTLNQIIERRGRTEAIGGQLERREQVPQEWKAHAEQMYR